MNPEAPTPREELEAKLTALLLGELGDEEAAVLREAMAKDAELAALLTRLEQTIGLVRETAANPAAAAAEQPTPLRLSEERREKLLAHFKTVAPKEFAEPARRKAWSVSVPLQIAAVVALLGCLAGLFLPALSKSKAKAQRAMLMNNLRQADGGSVTYEQPVQPASPQALDGPTVNFLSGSPPSRPALSPPPPPPPAARTGNIALPPVELAEAGKDYSGQNVWNWGQDETLQLKRGQTAADTTTLSGYVDMSSDWNRGAQFADNGSQDAGYDLGSIRKSLKVENVEIKGNVQTREPNAVNQGLTVYAGQAVPLDWMGLPGSTLTTGNPNVAREVDGKLVAVGAGSAMVSGRLDDGTSVSKELTVLSTSPVIAHRWSFTTNTPSDGTVVYNSVAGVNAPASGAVSFSGVGNVAVTGNDFAPTPSDFLKNGASANTFQDGLASVSAQALGGGGGGGGGGFGGGGGSSQIGGFAGRSGRGGGSSATVVNEDVTPTLTGSPSAANPVGTFPGLQNALASTRIAPAVSDNKLTSGLRNQLNAQAQPVVTSTTGSGRQAQMQAVDIQQIVTGTGLTTGGTTAATGTTGGTIAGATTPAFYPTTTTPSSAALVSGPIHRYTFNNSAASEGVTTTPAIIPSTDVLNHRLSFNASEVTDGVVPAQPGKVTLEGWLTVSNHPDTSQTLFAFGDARVTNGAANIDTTKFENLGRFDFAIDNFTSAKTDFSDVLTFTNRGTIYVGDSFKFDNSGGPSGRIALPQTTGDLDRNTVAVGRGDYYFAAGEVRGNVLAAGGAAVPQTAVHESELTLALQPEQTVHRVQLENASPQDVQQLIQELFPEDKQAGQTASTQNNPLLNRATTMIQNQVASVRGAVTTNIYNSQPVISGGPNWGLLNQGTTGTTIGGNTMPGGPLTVQVMTEDSANKLIDDLTGGGARGGRGGGRRGGGGGGGAAFGGGGAGGAAQTRTYQNNTAPGPTVTYDKESGQLIVLTDSATTASIQDMLKGTEADAKFYRSLAESDQNGDAGKKQVAEAFRTWEGDHGNGNANVNGVSNNFILDEFRMYSGVLEQSNVATSSDLANDPASIEALKNRLEVKTYNGLIESRLIETPKNANNLGLTGSNVTVSSSGAAINTAALVQDGRYYYEMGKYEEADAMLKQALAADPANVAAQQYEGYIRERRASGASNQIDVSNKRAVQQVTESYLTPKQIESLSMSSTNVTIRDLAARKALESPKPAAAPVANEDQPAPRAASPLLVAQPETLVRENAFSTFSLNVSDVAFKLAGASLEKGVMPDAGSMRSEEFINAFDYRDPEPVAGQAVGFAFERARYPFAHNRDLLRFSVKTAAAGRLPSKPMNIVLLLDNSGSMERADRVAIIRAALRVLASQLQPGDRVSVVTFARTARLWVDGISGAQAAQVLELISELTPEGGTNLGDALDLAYATARRHYLAGGVNCVVLLTDGAANLGNVDPEGLKLKADAQRQQGVATDCFGIGWEGYNDDLLEVLARNGDGRYGFINSPEEAATGFAAELAGALHVEASDVKVQVEFNPRRVVSYRQIGYAKHQLTKEQFRDNTVHAAQIGPAEAGNGLYTVEVNPQGDGPVCTVRVRYRDPGTANYYEKAWDVPYTGGAPALELSSAAMRLAATASAFSEWLGQSPFAGEVTPDALLGYLRGVPEIFGADARPKQLEAMIREAKSVTGK